MTDFRFSPIKTKEGLFEAIKYTHFECFKLCKQSLGKYLPNSGNIGIFSHFDEEFTFLTGLRKELTVEAENWNNKYYHLIEPIVIASEGGVPETTYTFLYVRQPDSNVPQVGDVDFFLPLDEYTALKQSLTDNGASNGMRLANHPVLDMIQLDSEGSDVWGFVISHKMSDELK